MHCNKGNKIIKSIKKERLKGRKNGGKMRAITEEILKCFAYIWLTYITLPVKELGHIRSLEHKEQE